MNAIPPGDRSWKPTPVGVLPDSEEEDLRFQVDVNMANAKMTPPYPPVGHATIDAKLFYKSPDPVGRFDSFRVTFEELKLKQVEGARILIMHDSCLPSISLPPIVFKDTLAVSVPMGRLSEMAGIAANILRQGKSKASILLIIGGIDLIRRVALGWDFNKTTSPTKEEMEKITKEYILQFKAILSLHQSRHLPEKTVVCSPPALSQRPPDFHAIFHQMAGVSRNMGLPYILTGKAVKRCNDVHPNQISEPATWKFMTQFSHSLPSVGISPDIILTQSDIIGRDEYDFWKRSCSLSVIPRMEWTSPETTAYTLRSGKPQQKRASWTPT